MCEAFRLRRFIPVSTAPLGPMSWMCSTSIRTTANPSSGYLLATGSWMNGSPTITFPRQSPEATLPPGAEFRAGSPSGG